MTSRSPDFTARRDRAVEKLATLVRIPTVSHRDTEKIDVADAHLDFSAIITTLREGD